MSAYDLVANNMKISIATADISQGNITDTGWLGFLDALGWVENSGRYGGNNGVGFHGIYQVGAPIAIDLHFFDSNGIGGGLLGVTNLSALEKDPVAQELFGIMMFSGIPNVTQGKPFSSRYGAARYEAGLISGFSAAKFDQMVGKIFTIVFKDSSGNIVATKDVLFSQAAISAAAHLVGQRSLAKAMFAIYSSCFDSSGSLISSTTTLYDDFADGNNVSFSTYMEILGKYDVSALIAARGGLAGFIPLVRQLIQGSRSYAHDINRHRPPQSRSQAVRRDTRQRWRQVAAWS